MKQANTTFLLLTTLLFIVIFCFGIFSDGMFFDGIMYANVARNYAHGLGSFWSLNHGNSERFLFFEQPPLTFAMQAQFFKLFGDSIYVERFYDFLFAIIHLGLIRFLWAEVTNSRNKLYWVPMILWMSIPLCSWTFRNNLEEVTMGAFDLAAIILILKGCRKNNLLYFLAGSFFILLASLTKGIQALFPIAAPFFYWIIYKQISFKTLLIQFMLTISLPVVAYIIFYFTPEANYSIGLYLERRIGGTFNHLQDTKKSHLYLLFKLMFELLAPFSLVALMWAIFKNKIHSYSIDQKKILLLLLIGISASFPLMVTLEQRAFYLTTSLPYYVIALSLAALPLVNVLMGTLEGRNYLMINRAIIALIIVASIAVFLNAKNPKRDHDLLADLYIFEEIIPRGTTFSIPESLNMEWAYHAYFIRYCYVNLDAHNKHTYYLIEGVNSQIDEPGYLKLDLPLKKFSLFKATTERN